jgi:hypothetical protein
MTTWNDVVVAIPTCPERQRARHALYEQLAAQCGPAILMVHEHVAGEPVRVDFPRVLRLAAEQGRPWILQLEDDVQLCPNFGAEALAHGLDQADVVTLFSRSKADLAAMDRGEVLRKIGPSSFSMSQAFFIRADLAVGIEGFAPGWYAAHPEHNRAADLLLGAYLSQKKARVLVRVPSLVQHKRLPSTLPGHHGARQSESFTRAFGRCGT